MPKHAEMKTEWRCINKVAVDQFEGVSEELTKELQDFVRGRFDTLQQEILSAPIFFERPSIDDIPLGFHNVAPRIRRRIQNDKHLQREIRRRLERYEHTRFRIPDFDIEDRVFVSDGPPKLGYFSNPIELQASCCGDRKEIVVMPMPQHVSGWCHPTRQQMLTERAIEVDEHSVFSPRPEYVPAESE